jgi:Cdc37 Hsp90 binding domain
MSRRPAPSGLTKDTSEGQAYSRGSLPSGLGLDITSVHSGDYSGLVRFIKKYPRIADTQEIQRLLAQASVHKTAGESSLAETCVHHALVLRKWCSLGAQEAGKYFESLAEGGQTTTEFMHDVTKVLMALPQKRAHVLTATGTTQSQTRVFRENDDERLYYLEEQGHLLRPVSNRRNPEPSRTLNDPATNDRNNREHSRTLVGHQRDLPSRRRQENPEPPRSLHDAATDDRNNREYGRTLVVHQQDLPSRQCQEDPEPSRPFSDVATDDRNNREHSRMLAGHQRDLPSRQRQENPKHFRSLNDTATDDQNSREHGRTLVRYDPMPSSRHRQESPDSTSRRKPQGEPELPLKPYFLPKEGINDDVVQRDSTWHSGATASTRPSVYNVSFRNRGQKRAHTFAG